MRMAVAVAALVLCVVGCGGGGSGPVSPVHGVLPQIHTDATGQVTTFTMRDDAGKAWDFTFQPEPGANVAATHLRVHIDQRLPVKVKFYAAGSTRIATRIDDG